MSQSSYLDGARVFFLGAGFSAEAGIPLTDALLPRAMALFRAEAPGLCERISEYANDVDVDLERAPNAQDFARFCTYLDFIELREHGGGERWSKEGCRERVALKFFLAKAIASATPDNSALPICYKQFAENLKPCDIVVTFNWDVLLENACTLAGVQFSYRFEEGKVHILKLHGSVNWIEGQPQALALAAPTFSYQPIGYAEGMNETEIFVSNQLRDAREWIGARCLVDEVKPLLVLPGYGKAVDVRLLSSIWYRPEFLNALRGGVSIIGLSIAPDDYLVESLFRYLLRAVFDANKRVRVLNPDPLVGLKFQSMAGLSVQVKVVVKRFGLDTVRQALLVE